MALKFKATVDQPAWLKMIRDKQRPVATAAVAALRETAANSVQEGRRNIAGAGKFGPKWQQGLQFRTIDAEEGGEPSLQAKAIIFHQVRHRWRVRAWRDHRGQAAAVDTDAGRRADRPADRERS